MQDINALYHNREIATNWLFKGHAKEIPAVGDIPDDESIVEEKDKDKEKKGDKDGPTIRALDFHSII